MGFDFDSVIDRRGTHSLKWARYGERDVLPLWVADMDFPAPPAVLAALRARLDHGILGYTVPPPALNEAVVERMARLYDWAIDPHWIVWLPGMVVALNLACRCVGAAGDEVLSFTPIYPPFLSAPAFSERRLVRVPLGHDGRRSVMDLDRFARAITPDARVLLFCNPHNPVGRSYGRGELEALAEICLRHDLLICSDEIHGDLLLDETARHIPTATLSPEVAARTITLMAPSKTFNLPGLNCAFGIIPDGTLRRRFQETRRGIVPDVGVCGLEGALAAYTQGQAWYEALIPALRANRDRVAAAVADMPGLHLDPVEATYLAWIDVRELGLDHPARRFEEGGVGLSDGRDFDGPGFLRLNFGCPRATLDEALARMDRVVAALG